MSRKSILTTFLLATATLLVVFLWRGGHWLVAESDLQEADAVVVLLGGTPERELEAADVYNNGYAQKIILSRFATHSRKLLDSFRIEMPSGSENTVSVLRQLGVAAEHIVIAPGTNSSTRGEARAVANYLGQHPHIGSVILVTSPPHMRRASMTFKREFRKLDRRVDIIARPSSHSDFEPKHWYRCRQHIRRVLMEYLKIAGWATGFS